MTPHLSKLIDALLPRWGLALAAYRIGLLTLERDAAQAALKIERARAAHDAAWWDLLAVTDEIAARPEMVLGWHPAEVARRVLKERRDEVTTERVARLEAEARLTRWRDALGNAWGPPVNWAAPQALRVAVRAILDE